MYNLYLKLLEAFKNNQAKFTAEGLRNIQHIDLYRGQPVAPERFEVFDLPALFLEYEISWKDTGRTREGLLQMDVHIMLDPHHSTSSNSPNRLSGLDIMKYHKIVDQILDGLEAEDTSQLHLSNERPVEADVVNYHIITYQANVYKPPKDYDEATPEGVDISGGLFDPKL